MRQKVGLICAWIFFIGGLLLLVRLSLHLAPINIGFLSFIPPIIALFVGLLCILTAGYLAGIGLQKPLQKALSEKFKVVLFNILFFLGALGIFGYPALYFSDTSEHLSSLILLISMALLIFTVQAITNQEAS